MNELTSEETKSILCLLVNGILPRRRIDELLLCQVKRVDGRIDHEVERKEM